MWTNAPARARQEAADAWPGSSWLPPTPLMLVRSAKALFCTQLSARCASMAEKTAARKLGSDEARARKPADTLLTPSESGMWSRNFLPSFERLMVRRSRHKSAKAALARPNSWSAPTTSCSSARASRCG
eukprot:1034419-Prymnesium_polylepis.1